MAIGTIGQTVTVSGGGSLNYTYIDKRNPATVKGKITSVTIQINSIQTPNSAAVKIFRINGANYEVVYDQTVSGIATGVNVITLTTPQNVLVGDLLGYYTGVNPTATSLGYQAGAGTGYHAKVGDITTTTAIADWSTGTETMGLYAEILPIPKGGLAIGSPMMY